MSASKAMAALGWAPRHDVKADLGAGGFYAADFFKLGLDKGDLDTSEDGL